ncbi:MAG TPA: protein kinase [Polyangiaceae bacterium]|nr:protein kinase [Polyangiaceae bacterium]
MVAGRLLSKGDVLVDYRVVQFMTQGSVAQVYEVEHVRTCRRFALKCVDAAGTTEEQRSRVKIALRTLMDVRHEGLPAVLDGDFTEGKLWLAQELVTGRFVVKGDPTPHWIKMCGWALPVSQALMAAFDKGLLHGDLSPEAIVLSKDGAPQVLGMGGYHLYGFSPEVVRLSPEFRSPEQRAGQEIDARSDIYSFGLLMCASLSGTGRAPEEVRTYQDVPGCPQALGEIIALCAQRDPAKRLSSWRKVEHLLRAVALHQIVSPDALTFSGPSSGVRGRDEPEEDEPSSGDAPSGEVVRETLASGEAARDTLTSVPFEVTPEQGASLSVAETASKVEAAGRGAVEPKGGGAGGAGASEAGVGVVLASPEREEALPDEPEVSTRRTGAYPVGRAQRVKARWAAALALVVVAVVCALLFGLEGEPLKVAEALRVEVPSLEEASKALESPAPGPVDGASTRAGPEEERARSSSPVSPLPAGSPSGSAGPMPPRAVRGKQQQAMPCSRCRDGAL